MGPESSDREEITRFEEQFRRNPDSLVFARLADACRKAGDPERALTILREGIRRHPDYASAHIVRARVLDDLDRPSDAEASLRRVLELDAQNLVAMRGLAGLAERRGDPVEAIHWFQQIAGIDPTNDEASEAAARLRRTLPETPPGLEPLPAPREEWWSSPAFEIVEEAREAERGDGADDADRGDDQTRRGGDETSRPGAAEAASSDGEEDDPETPEGGTDGPDPEGSAGGSAWWFEDPAGKEDPEDDGDLLTRTMAELYAKQGLVDAAAAIYRELLADHPEDASLRRALEELDGDGASGPREADEAAGSGESGEPVETPDEPDDRDERDEAAPEPEAPIDGSDPRGSGSAADPYASHPVPTTAAASEVFRDWLRRLDP